MSPIRTALIEDAGTTSTLSAEELRALHLDTAPVVGTQVAGGKPGDPMAQNPPRQPGDPMANQGNPRDPKAPCLGDPMACQGKPREPQGPCLGDPMACQGKPR